MITKFRVLDYAIFENIQRTSTSQSLRVSALRLAVAECDLYFRTHSTSASSYDKFRMRKSNICECSGDADMRPITNTWWLVLILLQRKMKKYFHSLQHLYALKLIVVPSTPSDKLSPAPLIKLFTTEGRSIVSKIFFWGKIFTESCTKK